MRKREAALRLVGVGWYVGICIILGILGGKWLDDKLKTDFLVIVGLLFGIIAAFYGVYRMLLPNISKNQDKENN